MKTLTKIIVFMMCASGAISAQAGTEPMVDAAVVCEYYAEFKNYNKVLCASAAQFKEANRPLLMVKSLACLYPEVRRDLRLCPNAEVRAMDLPEIPFLEGELPMWPVDMSPVLTHVNGKALNTVLPMHQTFHSEEFEVDKYCISAEGDLKKTDRILCAPFVNDLPLADAGRYDGDVRDLLIERLKKKIQELEIELGLRPAPLSEHTFK